MTYFEVSKVKNKDRRFAAPAYYHVYNRGVGKQKIFLDSQDKRKFVRLLERYLVNEGQALRGDGLPYAIHDVKLIAYCLMGNHFHLLMYQPTDNDELSAFMKQLTTAYSMYFNLRHKRVGPVFQGMFQAVRVMSDSHFDHLTRYIHLNPRTYRTYYWSSLPEYLGKRQTSWVYPEYASELTPAQYLEFLEDYVDRSKLLHEIKTELNL